MTRGTFLRFAGQIVPLLCFDSSMMSPQESPICKNKMLYYVTAAFQNQSVLISAGVLECKATQFMLCVFFSYERRWSVMRRLIRLHNNIVLNCDGIQTLFGVHGRNGLGETVNGVEAQANGLSVGAMKGPGVIPAHVYNVNAADFIAVGIDVIELFSGENA